MNDIKMIVMDLDGTLLTKNQNILPYTKDVLMKYQEKGISLVLASGRDIDSIQKIGKKLNMSDYLQNTYICLNGLEIYDMENRLLHKEEKLKYEDGVQLADLAKKYHIDMIFFFKDCLYILGYGNTGIINDHFMTSVKNEIHDISEIPMSYFDCLKKIAFIQTAGTMSQIIKDLQNEVENKYELCMVEDAWVEINPLGLSKGHALKVLSGIKNIPLNQMIAFGNGENDIDMLKTAGIGVAMGNSFESVKSAADDICDDCENNGIAKYLINM